MGAMGGSFLDGAIGGIVRPWVSDVLLAEFVVGRSVGEGGVASRCRSPPLIRLRVTGFNTAPKGSTGRCDGEGEDGSLGGWRGCLVGVRMAC